MNRFQLKMPRCPQVFSSFWRPALCFLVLEILIRYFIAGDNLASIVVPSFVYATGYALIFWIASRFSLLSLTLCYLGLPYLIFAFGWLYWLIAIVLAVVLVWSLMRVYLHSKLENLQAVYMLPYPVTATLFVAFLVIITWLHLSGAGGNGFQNIDYLAHNGRLKELIDYSWPVHYGDGSVLVFYVGYYLPAALLGKFAGLSAAYSFLYFWTLTGVWLAFLWMAALSLCSSRLLVLAALLMVFYGGWDFVDYVFRAKNFFDGSMPAILNVANFRIDFWASELLHFNIGAYLSNTFQLYWAPHQIVAGWLVASMLLALYLRRQYSVIFIPYILCALWAPLLLLALSPLLFFLCISEGKKSIIKSFSLENIACSCVFLLIFGSYYLGGSALTNPSGFLWNFIDIYKNMDVISALFLFSWGVSAVAIIPFVFSDDRKRLYFFLALLLNLFILPWYWYGEWADLMCRGSAPLMFLLMVFCMRCISLLAISGRYICVCFLILIVFSGGISALRHFRQSLLEYHHEFEFDMRSIDSPTSVEYVGSEQSFFFRYFSR